MQSPAIPQPPLRIGLLLLPAFNSFALNAFIDPLRAANYLNGQPLYNWQLLSLDGPTVIASNGFSIGPTMPFDSVKDAFDFVVINASWTPERFQHRKLQIWLRDHASQGATLVGIDTGAFVLAFAGLLNGYRTAVHYDHMDSFWELFPDIELDERLYVFDNGRISCCGGAAALDVALEIIRLQHGMKMANRAARYIFHERLRAGDEQQLSTNHEPIGYAIPELLREAILLMEQHLVRPTPLPELARQVGISQRQLTRLFREHTGLTPKRYYLNTRLNRARSLLTQTELSIAEVADACGFKSAEHFTRMYSARFNIRPSQDRKEGRIPFQFRSYPSFTGL